MNLVVSADTMRSQVMTMQMRAADHPALGRGDHRLGEIVGDMRHRLPHGGRRILEIGADTEGRPVGLQDGDLVDPSSKAR